MLIREDEHFTDKVVISPNKRIPNSKHYRNPDQSHSINSAVRSNFTGVAAKENVAGFESINEFVRWENSVRLSGVSLFPVNYCDIEYMGIRLEMFSELDLRYKLPLYIILKPSAKIVGAWELFKHSLPKYVQIYHYWEQCTDSTDTSNSNIMKFANLCYKDILNVHSRVEFFHKLDKASDDKTENQFSLLKIDEMGYHVSFRLGAAIVNIINNDRNEIVNCAINDQLNMSFLGSIFDLPGKFDLVTT